MHTLKEKLSEHRKENEQLQSKHNTLTSGNSLIQPSEEVKTLRRVKKELEKQLNASQSTTLSFQASFQAEFDLRAQLEQKLEELRERYEVSYCTFSTSPKKYHNCNFMIWDLFTNNHILLYETMKPHCNRSKVNKAVSLFNL